jgi:hypothetical protein
VNYARLLFNVCANDAVSKQEMPQRERALNSRALKKLIDEEINSPKFLSLLPEGSSLDQ